MVPIEKAPLVERLAAFCCPDECPLSASCPKRRFECTPWELLDLPRVGVGCIHARADSAEGCRQLHTKTF